MLLPQTFQENITMVIAKNNNKYIKKNIEKFIENNP